MLLRQRTGRPNSACGLHYDLCRFGLRCLIQNSADCSSFMPKLTTTARSTRGLANNFNCITGRKKKNKPASKSTLLLLGLSKQGDIQLRAKQSTTGNDQLFQAKYVYKTPFHILLTLHCRTPHWTRILSQLHLQGLCGCRATPTSSCSPTPRDKALPSLQIHQQSWLGLLPAIQFHPKGPRSTRPFSLKCLPWLFSPDT